MSERPLSPFLLYRFMYTMVLSFAHRATGVFMSLGALLLVYGLVALAGDVASFEQARVVFRHWLVQLVMFGLTLSFFYHLSNGVRHLFWDMGYGFERSQARASGRVAVVAAVLIALVLLWLAFGGRGGAA